MQEVKVMLGSTEATFPITELNDEEEPGMSGPATSRNAAPGQMTAAMSTDRSQAKLASLQTLNACKNGSLSGGYSFGFHSRMKQ